MTSVLLQQVVDMVRQNVTVAGELLPTFVDPATRQVRVLTGAPADAAVVSQAQTWAKRQEVGHYFLAYAVSDTVVVEEYDSSGLIDSQTTVG